MTWPSTRSGSRRNMRGPRGSLVYWLPPLALLPPARSHGFTGPAPCNVELHLAADGSEG
jgi:hypothetical protein